MCDVLFYNQKIKKGRDFMAIQVEVWGEYACFTRPEMKTERVSYDCMAT